MVLGDRAWWGPWPMDGLLRAEGVVCGATADGQAPAEGEAPAEVEVRVAGGRKVKDNVVGIR